MSEPHFALGVADARAGRAFHRDYDIWKDGHWAYERGRMWAVLAPRDFPLKLGGRLNPKAIRFYDDSII